MALKRHREEDNDNVSVRKDSIKNAKRSVTGAGLPNSIKSFVVSSKHNFLIVYVNHDGEPKMFGIDLGMPETDIPGSRLGKIVWTAHASVLTCSIHLLGPDYVLRMDGTGFVDPVRILDIKTGNILCTGYINLCGLTCTATSTVTPWFFLESGIVSGMMLMVHAKKCDYSPPGQTLVIESYVRDIGSNDVIVEGSCVSTDGLHLILLVTADKRNSLFIFEINAAGRERPPTAKISLGTSFVYASCASIADSSGQSYVAVGSTFGDVSIMRVHDKRFVLHVKCTERCLKIYDIMSMRMADGRYSLTMRTDWSTMVEVFDPDQWRCFSGAPYIEMVNNPPSSFAYECRSLTCGENLSDVVVEENRFRSHSLWRLDGNKVQARPVCPVWTPQRHNTFSQWHRLQILTLLTLGCHQRGCAALPFDIIECIVTFLAQWASKDGPFGFNFETVFDLKSAFERL